jgi:Putative Flp pilus-assembly TadE/G-like
MKSHSQRGQVLPLIGVMLGVLMGFGGMGVDVGYWEYVQQSQQSATDAAATGGARALITQSCPNYNIANAAADADASSNGFPNGGSITVAVQNPPSGGPLAGDACAVSVTISSQNVSSFFARMFGYSSMTESTTAIATLASSNSGCIYLLTTTQNSDLSNSHIEAPHCGIVINASANMSNATIDAAMISYAGTTAPNISGASFPEATPAPALIAADPCPQIPGCAYLANNPPSTVGCGSGGNYQNTTLTQGCYNKMSLSGTITMMPGLYVINGQLHMNNATVTGSGVTIYMTNAVSDTNFSNAHINLSPPTTGSTAKVLLYRVPTQSSAVDFSTCSCNFSGLQYFPTTKVNYSNVGGGYTVLVFGQANFSTSSTLDLGDPPVGSTLLRRAVLAQ